MKLDRLGLCSLCVALATVACSGVSDFEGRWSARSVQGDGTCNGEYENSDPDYEIKLRAGEDSDLEYVSFAFDDPSKVTCVQGFTVDGDVATIDDDQDCTFEYETVDSTTQETVIITSVIAFPSDRLELDGDELHETGKSHQVVSDGTECSEDFEIDFKRVD